MRASGDPQYRQGRISSPPDQAAFRTVMSGKGTSVPNWRPKDRTLPIASVGLRDISSMTVQLENWPDAVPMANGSESRSQNDDSQKRRFGNDDFETPLTARRKPAQNGFYPQGHYPLPSYGLPVWGRTPSRETAFLPRLALALGFVNVDHKSALFRTLEQRHGRDSIGSYPHCRLGMAASSCECRHPKTCLHAFAVARFAWRAGLRGSR